jgi:hypothetical protein
MKSVLALSLFLIFCHFVSAEDQVANATAKFLAGLPVRGTALEKRSPDPEWATHAAELDRAWNRLDEEQLSKIREWAPQYLGDFYRDNGCVFYMFSGPDFLYANAFFPNGRTYILCGTEPVGPVPNIDNISAASLPLALANLRKSLDSVLRWSFFITKDMKIDLKQTQLSGTLPVFYVFIARAGGTIESVSPISLDQTGNIAAQGKTSGVKIVFANSNATEQTLYYFSTDLSNDGIKSAPGLIKFCEKRAPGISFLKAASYLMHENGFSTIRDFLLTRSTMILQDPSGIPIKFFDQSKWNMRYCGDYVGPIDIFKKYEQPDLAADYAKSAAAPLSFGFGYEWQPSRSSLIIATRK